MTFLCLIFHLPATSSLWVERYLRTGTSFGSGGIGGVSGSGIGLLGVSVLRSSVLLSEQRITTKLMVTDTAMSDTANIIASTGVLMFVSFKKVLVIRDEFAQV